MAAERVAAGINFSAVRLDLDDPRRAPPVYQHLVEELLGDDLRITRVEGAIQHVHAESSAFTRSGVGIGSFVPILTPT